MSAPNPLDPRLAERTTTSYEAKVNNEYLSNLHKSSQPLSQQQSPLNRFHNDIRNEAINLQKARFFNQTKSRFGSYLPIALGIGAIGAFAYYYPTLSRPKHEVLHGSTEVLRSARDGLHSVQQQSQNLRQSLEQQKKHTQ